MAKGNPLAEQWPPHRGGHSPFPAGCLPSPPAERGLFSSLDLRPSAIIRDLDLRKPIYRQLAAYGHMGREDLGVTWEKTDRVEAIKAALED